MKVIYWPGTNIIKSTHTGFNWDTGEPTVFARDPYFRANAGAAATASRERMESDTGRNTGTMYGLSDKSDKSTHRGLDPKAFHVYAKAGKK